MKRVCIVVSGIFLSLVLFVYSGWAAHTAPRDKALFYQDGGCDSGNYATFGVGEYPDLRAYKIAGYGGATWNDQISCIAIGSGITRVIVYEDINFGGRSKEFTRSWGNRDDSWDLRREWWNDRISSIRVIGPGSSEPSGKSPPRDKALFYQDGGCDSGNYATLGVGEYPDLRAYKIAGYGGATWNDQISCIAIGSGITRVIVYEDINFGGRSKEFTRSWGNRDDSWDLRREWWNDRISSIKVIGPGSSEPSGKSPPHNKAWFYQDGGCDSGNYATFGVGEYPDLRAYKIAGGATWNDQISCIAIGSGITRVIVYEDINFGGRSKEFTRSWGNRDDSWDLGRGWWNDRISSIKVR